MYEVPTLICTPNVTSEVTHTVSSSQVGDKHDGGDHLGWCQVVDPALLKINYNILKLMPKDQPKILSHTLGDLLSEMLPTILLRFC